MEAKFLSGRIYGYILKKKKINFSIHAQVFYRDVQNLYICFNSPGPLSHASYCRCFASIVVDINHMLLFSSLRLLVQMEANFAGMFRLLTSMSS